MGVPPEVLQGFQVAQSQLLQAALLAGQMTNGDGEDDDDDDDEDLDDDEDDDEDDDDDDDDDDDSMVDEGEIGGEEGDEGDLAAPFGPGLDDDDDGFHEQLALFSKPLDSVPDLLGP